MSEKMREYFLRIGVSTNKIELIYPGVDMNMFGVKSSVEAESIEGVLDNDKVVMYAGSFAVW